MEEKELIRKIKELKQIKPNQDWVVLAKNQILGSEIPGVRASASFFPFWKPALITLTTCLILAGVFSFAQDSLPGEILYPVKKISERAQTIFVSEDEKPQMSLELANKRLEELAEVAKTNQAENLAPAINEFKTSISEAAENLTKVKTPNSDFQEIREVVDKTKDIEKKTKEIQSWGVVIGEEDLKELQMVSKKIELESLVITLKNDLENRALTEEQKEILDEMKELITEEKYLEALELWLNQ